MRSLWYNTAQCVFEKDVHAWKPYVFTTIFTFIISLAYSIPCYLDCKKSKKNYQLYTFALCTITVQKVQKELPALYICPKHNTVISTCHAITNCFCVLMFFWKQM